MLCCAVVLFVLFVHYWRKPTFVLCALFENIQTRPSKHVRVFSISFLGSVQCRIARKSRRGWRASLPKRRPASALRQPPSFRRTSYFRPCHVTWKTATLGFSGLCVLGFATFGPHGPSLHTERAACVLDRLADRACIRELHWRWPVEIKSSSGLRVNGLRVRNPVREVGPCRGLLEEISTWTTLVDLRLSNVSFEEAQRICACLPALETIDFSFLIWAASPRTPIFGKAPKACNLLLVVVLAGGSAKRSFLFLPLLLHLHC